MYGLRVTLNLSSFLLFFPVIVPSLIRLNTQDVFDYTRGICRECGSMNSFWVGIFCAHYSQSRDRWEACRGMQCRCCYKSPTVEPHRVVRPQEVDEFDLTLEGDENRHMMVIYGDHLLILFQRNLYQFRNVKIINTRDESEDLILLRTTRRANLDASQSREILIVSATKLESNNLDKIGKRVDLTIYFLEWV